MDCIASAKAKNTIDAARVLVKQYDNKKGFFRKTFATESRAVKALKSNMQNQDDLTKHIDSNPHQTVARGTLSRRILKNLSNANKDVSFCKEKDLSKEVTHNIKSGVSA